MVKKSVLKFNKKCMLMAVVLAVFLLIVSIGYAVPTTYCFESGKTVNVVVGADNKGYLKGKIDFDGSVKKVVGLFRHNNSDEWYSYTYYLDSPKYGADVQNDKLVLDLYNAVLSLEYGGKKIFKVGDAVTMCVSVSTTDSNVAESKFFDFDLVTNAVASGKPNDNSIIAGQIRNALSSGAEKVIGALVEKVGAFFKKTWFWFLLGGVAFIVLDIIFIVVAYKNKYGRK